MNNKHRKQPEIVQDEQKKRAQERLQDFRDQVEYLHLKNQRNELQIKLTGCAIDERIDAFIDIEINIAERHPEVLTAVIEERNNFLQAVGIPEEEYARRYAKDLQGRKEANAPASGSGNPSEQLHSIKEQIDQQQGEKTAETTDIPPETPAEVSDETTGEPLIPVVEPADEVSQPLSGEPPEPDFSDPEHPANQRSNGI